MNTPKTLIPWLMATGRAILGPILIAAVRANWSPVALAGIVLTALLSDIFDGILARHWHTDTAALRLSDSLADTAFYLATGIALWIYHPALFLAHRSLLFALIAAEACKFTFDFLKFRKPASYHSYLAKSWGLILAATVITIFLNSQVASNLLRIALWTGIACNLQDMIMTAILPTWHRDIKTIPAALRLRLELLADTKLGPPLGAPSSTGSFIAGQGGVSFAEANDRTLSPTTTPCPIHRAPAMSGIHPYRQTASTPPIPTNPTRKYPPLIQNSTAGLPS